MRSRALVWLRQSILGLLIKAGQYRLTGCFRHAVSGDYSGETVGQSTVASNIMKNFHSAPNCWFPSCCVCVNALCIFHSWRFSCPCRNTSETTHTADVLRRSRQAIIFPVITTLLTFHLHVSFASPHPSCQSMLWAVLIICDASFLP